MYNVLINGGGKATRLQPVLEYKWPKCLTPVGGISLLKLQHDYWSSQKGFGQLAVITTFADKVEAYCKLNGLDIIVVADQSHTGSANGIRENVPPSFLNKPCLIQWSDLLLTVPIGESLGDCNACIVVAATDIKPGEGYRCNCQRDGHIYPSPDLTGNVPGIYYFANLLSPAEPFADNCDLAENKAYAEFMLDDAFSSHLVIKPDGLTDVGDMLKLAIAEQKFKFRPTTKSADLTLFSLDWLASPLLWKRNGAAELDWFILAKAYGLPTPECVVMPGTTDLVMTYYKNYSTAAQLALDGKLTLRQQSDVESLMLKELRMCRCELRPVAFDHVSYMQERLIERNAPIGFVELGLKIANKLNIAASPMPLHGFTHGDLHWANVLVAGPEAGPESQPYIIIDPCTSIAMFKPFGYALGKALYNYYTWHIGYYGHCYGQGDSFSPTLLQRGFKPPSWLSSPVAQLWCAYHLLTAPGFFRYDAIRYELIRDANLYYAQQLFADSTSAVRQKQGYWQI